MVEQIPLSSVWKILIFRLTCPIWIFIGYASHEFLLQLCSKSRPRTSHFFLLLATIASLIGVSTNLVEDQVILGRFGYYASEGYLQTWITLICGVLPFFMGIRLVVQQHAKAAPEERIPIRIVLWSTPVIFAVPILMSGILPLFGITDLTKAGTTGFTFVVIAYFLVTLSRADITLSISQAAQSLFRELKDGILLIDLDGSIEHANPAAISMLGHRLKDMNGERVEKFIPQFRNDQWYQDFPFEHSLGKIKKSFTMTVVLQKNQGVTYGKLLILSDTTRLTEMQNELVGRPESTERHAAVRVLALKEAQERIRAREQQLQSLIDNLPFQVFVKDRNSRYILQNRLDRETRGSLLGLEFEDAEKDPKRLEEGLHADPSVLLGESYECEFDLTRNGKNFRYRSMKRPIVTEDGKIEGILGVLIDISDVHKLEQERMEFKERLLHSHKMEAIGTLAGGIAHDFNNIIGSLQGYCELAMETIPTESPAQKYLKEVLIASDRGRQLVQEILTFSRKEEKERKPVSVNFTIRETMNLLKGNIPKSIQVNQSLPTREQFILGDAVELHRIIMNLCTNAIHSMKEKGGSLNVGCEEFHNAETVTLWNAQIPAGNWVCIQVSDTGHGIPENKISRIFDPFFTTKKTTEGTGLGLSVVLGIIQGWNGTIAVQSSSEGTHFKVFIPALIRRNRSTDTESEQVPILLFVQDQALVENIRKAVPDQAVQWLNLRNIEDIGRLWRVSPWKLALMGQADLDLPYELLIEQWRAQGIQSPFLVFSTGSSATPSNELDLLVRVAVLEPTCSVDTLRQTLQRFLWPTF